VPILLQFNVQIRIPRPSQTDHVFTIMVVGRGCVGNLQCWPTEDSYEAVDEAQINIYKLCLLAVPLRWTGTQADFDAAVDTQINTFMNAVPLSTCPQWVYVRKLSVTTQNYAGFTCSKGGCGVESIKPFVRNTLRIETAQYDVIVGLATASPCPPTAGCSDQTDTIWVLAKYSSVTAHEIGHLARFGGLSDQYCSNQAGSTDCRCNDGCVQGTCSTKDVNTLDASLPFDCPPDGSPDSNGTRCCNFKLQRYDNVLFVRLMPDGNGYYNGWTGSYTDVDDYPHDSDTTYINASSNNVYASFSIQNMTQATDISSIRVYTVLRETQAPEDDIVVSTLLRIGGVDYLDGLGYTSVTYSDLYTEYSTNPATSNPWSWTDINDLEAGLKIVSTSEEVRTTSVYIEVYVKKFIGIIKNCTDVDYGVCCLGNKNPAGGRSIMSYANAPDPRQFDRREIAILAEIPSLNCPGTAGDPPEENITDIAQRVIYTDLFVYQNDTVIEGEISLTAGIPSEYARAGDYNLVLSDGGNNTLWNQTLEIRFDYTGPVELDVDYSGISYDFFYLSFKIPFDPNMRYLRLYHKEKPIFSKTLDFGLGSITGLVTAYNGSTVSNATVYVFGENGFSTSGIVSSGINGSYAVKGLVSGSYSLHVVPPDPNLKGASTSLYVGAGTTSSVNFVLGQAGSIAGYVKDTNRNPIPNAYVYIDVYEPPRHTTDPNGYYIIPALDSGTYTFIAEPPMGSIFFQNSTTAQVVLGQTTIVNFTLRESGAISGIVADINGTPVYNAYVSVSGPSYGRDYTDVNGYYEIIGLATGNYTLTVDPPWGANFLSNSTTLRSLL